MIKCARIEFTVRYETNAEPVTKFGGQPVWIEDPQWPISKSTGEPMRFICQVALTSDLFGDIHGKMAYIFMTDIERTYVDETWDPDEGENAVIIQPGGKTNLPTIRLEVGPTLQRIVVIGERDEFLSRPCEYSVRLHPDDDPDFVSETDRWTWNDAERNDHYGEMLKGNKVAGTPGFMQGDAFPDEKQWKLILQLDSDLVPFWVNFGDAGIGYAFISEDGLSDKFLWQCA